MRVRPPPPAPPYSSIESHFFACYTSFCQERKQLPPLELDNLESTMFYLVARADIQVGEKTFEDQCVKFMKSGDGRHLLSWNGASIEVQINVDEIRIEFDTAEGALNHILISLDHYLLTVAECRARGWKSLTVTARHGQENHNCFYFRKSEGIRMDFVWLDDDPEVFTLERLTLPS